MQSFLLNFVKWLLTQTRNGPNDSGLFLLRQLLVSNPLALSVSWLMLLAAFILGTASIIFALFGLTIKTLLLLILKMQESIVSLTSRSRTTLRSFTSRVKAQTLRLLGKK